MDLGVFFSTVSPWERGRGRPLPRTRRRIEALAQRVEAILTPRAKG